MVENDNKQTKLTGLEYMVYGYAGGRFSIDKAKEAAKTYDNSVKMGAKLPKGKKKVSTTIFISLADISYLNKNAMNIKEPTDIEEWKHHTATIDICNTNKGVTPVPQADIPNWASKEKCCKAIKNIQKELIELGYTMKPTSPVVIKKKKHNRDYYISR